MWSALSKLKTLQKNGYVKSANLGSKTLWFLPKTKKPSTISYLHDLACAELYTAYGEYEMDWYCEEQKQFRYDALMVMDDLRIYWEVDRGTEPIKKTSTNRSSIEQKIDAYIGFARETDHRFFVVFDLVGLNVASRGDSILELLKAKKRGHQFLITKHAALVKNPEAELLVSPLNTAFCLDTLPNAS
jgi:hypothetical protein